MTIGALRRLNPVARPAVIYVKFVEGTDRAAGFTTLRRAVRPHGDVFGDESNNEVHTSLAVERVDELPLILVGLLSIAATAILLHLLVTSVRMRRHDLAVVRALGVRPRDARAIVAWQATTVTLIALVIGLPLGALAGARVWDFYAKANGAFPEGAVPVIGMVLAAIGGLLIANVVARWPAGVVARLKPAQVLRSE